MAGKRGGARPGSGRKKKAEKFAGPVAKAEKRICDKLPGLIDNLMKLADGGFEVVEEEWVPWSAEEDPNLPALPTAGNRLVRRKVSVAAPDRAANQYLIDRILGRPTVKAETDITSNGEAVRTVFYIPENGRGDDGGGADHQAPAGPSK